MGLFLGLIWALLIIHRRPPPPQGSRDLGPQAGTAGARDARPGARPLPSLRLLGAWRQGAAAGVGGGGLQKEAWLSSLVLEWGPAGHVVSVDGEVAGYSLYAPTHVLDQVGFQAARPVSRDAVLLATLAVLPEFEGQGIGRVLLQTMARDLTKRKVRAVEAFADRAPAGRDCRVPAEFLEASGFQVVRDHPRYPLMRMDLRTALTWKDAREAALEALRVPAPAQPALRPVPSSRQDT